MPKSIQQGSSGSSGGSGPSTSSDLSKPLPPIRRNSDGLEFADSMSAYMADKSGSSEEYAGGTSTHDNANPVKPSLPPGASHVASASPPLSPLTPTIPMSEASPLVGFSESSAEEVLSGARSRSGLSPLNPSYAGADSSRPPSLSGLNANRRSTLHESVFDPGFPLMNQRDSKYSIASALRRSSASEVDVQDAIKPPYLDGNAISSSSSFTSMKDDARQSILLSASDYGLLWEEGVNRGKDDDDELHNPKPSEKRDGVPFRAWSRRGVLNLTALVVIAGGLILLFLLWPIMTYVVRNNPFPNTIGFNLGGINASGQIPDIPNMVNLIDKDTPQSAFTKTGMDGNQYVLVFSDEFNEEGRTFWPGDDPYWEAVDLHYWATQDYEWYDPDAATTKGGNLEITITEEPIHGLSFRSAMLQSWNKFCFSDNAIIEVNLSLPGSDRAMGFWPGVWTEGNLARAGYGATNDGMWPYSYNTCDVGTQPNQTNTDGTTPTAAKSTGSHDYGGELSWLVGQRASACTCPGEDHPGPDVTVGRGAPEIDIIEAQVDYRGWGTASQSLQVAPFDAAYQWDNATAAGLQIYNTTRSFLNAFVGGINQEAASVISMYNAAPYDGLAYQRFGYQYQGGGNGQGYVTWTIDDEATWTVYAGAFLPNAQTQIGQRLISVEPMSININLALSKAFQTVQFDRLTFPAIMRVDYIRVWQKQGSTNVGCNPADHPTTDYIQKHLLAYTNANLTTWKSTNYSVPRNSRVTPCS